MKTKRLLPLLLIAFTTAAPAAENTPGPYFKFYITATADFEADEAVLNLSVTKKAGSFAAASSACNLVLNKVNASFESVNQKDVEFSIRKIQTIPTDTLLAKDYSVTGYIDIRLKDITLLAGILQQMTAIDKDIEIEDLAFEYSTPSLIRSKLIEVGQVKVKETKEFYEKLYSVKLTLYSLEEISDDLSLHFNDYGFIKRESKYKGLYEAPDTLPTNRFEMQYVAVFRIVSN